jgi:hypothetical protein
VNWLAALPDSKWWELVPAIIGAVIGAVAAGLPAYLLAVRSTEEALSKEQELRKKINKDRALNIFIIFAEAISDASDHFDQMEEYIERSDAVINDPYPLQRCVRAIANLNFVDFFRIPTADLVLLADAGELEFAQRLTHSLKTYNSVIDSLRKYSSLKEKQYELISQADALEISDTGMTKATVDKSTRDRATLLEAQLESIIKPTRLTLHEALTAMAEQALILGPTLRRCVGGSVFGFDEIEIKSLQDRLGKFKAEPRPRAGTSGQ